jgi:hypothetical protein
MEVNHEKTEESLTQKLLEEKEDITELSPDAIVQKIQYEFNKLQQEEKELAKTYNFRDFISREEIFKNIEELCEVLKKDKKRWKEVKHYQNLVKNLRGCLTLEPLFKTYNIENVLKYRRATKKNAEKLRKKDLETARRKLDANDKFRFIPPEMLRSRLMKRIPNDRKKYGILFIDLIISFSTIYSINNWGLFLTSTMTSVYKLGEEEYDFDFLQLIIDKCDEHCGEGSVYKLL